MLGMHRRRQKADYEETRAMLHRAEYGVLSTTCEDGLPYGVPLCFALSGNSLYFHCAPVGQKLLNLAHDRRVCFTAVSAAKSLGDRLTMAYESVMVFGTAQLVRGEDERREGLRLLMHKYAPQLPDEKGEQILRTQGPDTAVVRLDVEYMVGKTGHREALFRQGDSRL